MKAEDRKQRYLYAVGKKLPRKISADVERELSGLIDDMLEERTGDRVITDQDMRVVLAELGTPRELAAQYSPDANKSLIGPDYFATYKMILKIVVSCVASGVLVGTILAFFLEGRSGALSLLAQCFSNCLFGVVGAFTMLTLVFAFLEWRKIPLDELEDGEDLPPVPKKPEIIPRWETVLELVLGVIFAVAFIFFSQMFSFLFYDNGARVPVFAEGFFSSLWPVFLLGVVIDIPVQVLKLQAGRYTRRIGIANAISGVIGLVLMGVVFLRNDIFAPEFLAWIGRIADGEIPVVSQMLLHMNVVLYIIISIIVLAGIVEMLYKGFKYDVPEPEYFL